MKFYSQKRFRHHHNEKDFSFLLFVFSQVSITVKLLSGADFLKKNYSAVMLPSNMGPLWSYSMCAYLQRISFTFRAFSRRRFFGAGGLFEDLRHIDSIASC